MISFRFLSQNKISPRIRTPELSGRRNIISDDQSYTQETECLPEENVSIVEDMNSDDKLENMKAIVNGTVRRKLYFNPAYFEPQLLLVSANISFFSFPNLRFESVEFLKF